MLILIKRLVKADRRHLPSSALNLTSLLVASSLFVAVLRSAVSWALPATPLLVNRDRLGLNLIVEVTTL